jgi:hypothetical protein
MKFDTLVIVIGAFRGKKNEVVPKEISFVGTDGNADRWKGSYVFKEPYPESKLSDATRRTNSWISKNLLGGVKWEDGNISHIFWMELVRDLCANVASVGVIFTKGSEHAKLLRSILPDHVTVHDLDNLGCPKAEDIECTIDGNMECVALCGLPNHSMKICPMGKCIRYTLWWEGEKRDQDQILYIAWRQGHDTQAQELSTLIEKFSKLSLEMKEQDKELKQWKQELSKAEQKQKIAGHVLASSSSSIINNNGSSSSSSIEGYASLLPHNISDENEW